MPARIVRVRRRIAAPIERVFACIADHEGYARLPGVRRARLLRAGADERGGTGAQRELTIGPGRLTEQITAFDPPRYLAYRIVASPFPIEHIGSEIRLREIAGGTEVQWLSRFRVRTPVGRRLVERSMVASFATALGAALFFWQQILESDDPDWRQALPAGAATNAPAAERPPAVAPRTPRRRPAGPRALLVRMLRRAAAWPVRAAMRRR